MRQELIDAIQSVKGDKRMYAPSREHSRRSPESRAATP